MSPLAIGLLVGIVTVVVLASGIPVAFGLVVVALLFLALFDGVGSLVITGELFFSGLTDFTLVSIPMFIAMGAAVAASPAGGDLYGALDRWLYRIPGGLAISNLGGVRAVCRAQRFLARHLRRDRKNGHPRNAQARLSG